MCRHKVRWGGKEVSDVCFGVVSKVNVCCTSSFRRSSLLTSLFFNSTPADTNITWLFGKKKVFHDDDDDDCRVWCVLCVVSSWCSWCGWWWPKNTARNTLFRIRVYCLNIMPWHKLRRRCIIIAMREGKKEELMLFLMINKLFFGFRFWGHNMREEREKRRRREEEVEEVWEKERNGKWRMKRTLNHV